ncbi:MAG TPA: HupE/UreJ family protein [Vicinamibacteria bacterium]|nr:HupE/UreJ family protein [Vicinamibacteria bacterium]
MAALALALPSLAAAHDVPADVTVQAFLKPEGSRLHLLVRAPLAALRDIDYPTRGPGYLDLARVEPSLRQAARVWIADEIEIYEGDVRLSPPRIVAARVSLPSDRSFGTYEEAAAHLTAAPLPSETELYWSQGMLDVWFEYQVHSEESRLSIHPDLARLGLHETTVLRFLPPGGAVRAFELSGDPGLVRLAPQWHQAALTFVDLGFRHILEGTDHLLFLLCLVIPLRRLRPLVLVVTAFTVAHSVTLLASAFGWAPDALWFPPLVETLIAASIVYMALENIVAPHLRLRWAIAFAFGLVHGFGFSFALRQTLQFAGSHLLTSLLSFNVGVELGQLVVLGLLVPVLGLVFRFVPERTGTIVVSALVAHTGWHWMMERWDRLRQFRFPWPVPSAAGLASATRWLLLVVIAAGLAWLLLVVLLPAASRRAQKEAAPGSREQAR